MSEFCDYCYEDLPTHYRLRAVGFDEFEGVRAPLVKTWCGSCEVPDDIDPAAQEAFTAAILTQAAKRGRARAVIPPTPNAR